MSCCRHSYYHRLPGTVPALAPNDTGACQVSVLSQYSVTRWLASSKRRDRPEPRLWASAQADPSDLRPSPRGPRGTRTAVPPSGRVSASKGHPCAPSPGPALGRCRRLGCAGESGGGWAPPSPCAPDKVEVHPTGQGPPRHQADGGLRRTLSKTAPSLGSLSSRPPCLTPPRPSWEHFLDKRLVLKSSPQRRLLGSLRRPPGPP